MRWAAEPSHGAVKTLFADFLRRRPLSRPPYLLLAPGLLGLVDRTAISSRAPVHDRHASLFVLV